MPIRVYLTGRVFVEAGETLIGEQQLSGRQGRLAFAYLVLERSRAISREKISELLWADEIPRSWETSLSAVISNLRKTLGRAGLARAGVIEQAFGCYQLHLPPETWVDFEAAAQAVEDAEAAIKANDPTRAFGWVGIATSIARREFLPGEDCLWVDRRRSELRDILIRGLDCYCDLLIWKGDAHLAVRVADETVSMDPYREKGYRRLMRAHGADGNRAEGLRVYQKLRSSLLEDLGVDPSPETEATFLEILRQT